MRAKAAVFVSLLCCSVRQPEDPQKCFYMQVNRALHSLLDLLLEEFWDTSCVLEALVCHLPDCDMNAALKEAKETKYVNPHTEMTIIQPNRYLLFVCIIIEMLFVFKKKTIITVLLCFKRTFRFRVSKLWGRHKNKYIYTAFNVIKSACKVTLN